MSAYPFNTDGLYFSHSNEYELRALGLAQRELQGGQSKSSLSNFWLTPFWPLTLRKKTRECALLFFFNLFYYFNKETQYDQKSWQYQKLKQYLR